MQGHRAFRVYYAGALGNVTKPVRLEISGRGSSFVTGGALFGIKSIGRNAKHVVALDANAMEDIAGNGSQFWGTFGSFGARLGRSILGSHELMVARGGRLTKAACGIPNAVPKHLVYVSFPFGIKVESKEKGPGGEE